MGSVAASVKDSAAGRVQQPVTLSAVKGGNQEKNRSSVVDHPAKGSRLGAISQGGEVQGLRVWGAELNPFHNLSQ